VEFLFLSQLNNHAEIVKHLCFNSSKFLFLRICPVSCRCFIMCSTVVNPDCQVLLGTIHGIYQIQLDKSIQKSFHEIQIY
jgi:hypothetical protein